MRESFIFYKSFYESIKELEESSQYQIYKAIFEYQFENKKSNLKGLEKAIFTLIEPQLSANNKKYENGKKGGAPKGNKNAQKTTKKQPKNNQKQPNENENDNENENVNENNNDKLNSLHSFNLLKNNKNKKQPEIFEYDWLNDDSEEKKENE